MSIQGSQSAPAGEHQEHHGAPPGKHHEHHRGHVSPLEGRFGTHPLEPKKGPARATPKSLHSTGIGCKNGPRSGHLLGRVPPPYPLSLLAEQVLTFETKGSLGRAFVINLESESLVALAKQYCLDLPPMHDRRALCSTNLRTLVHGNWNLPAETCILCTVAM